MNKVRSYENLIQRYGQAAQQIGARMVPLGEFSCPLGEYTLYKMTFTFGNGQQKICISTGMHGDEPAGHEALLRGLIKLGDNRSRIDAEFTVFPCDNPTGYELNTRENYQGIDLNREFVKVGQAEEIRIIENELRESHFGFTLDLHEDVDTFGMYLYQRAQKGSYSLAEEMIEALRKAGHPIHEADWIEGLPASGGIIWPSGRLRKFELPKAVYLWHLGVRQLLTTESPGKLELEKRVEMQLVCFDVFIEALAAGRFCG